MLVKIVGIQAQKYKLDSGYEFEGDKVHAIDMETTENGQLGNQVMNFKIPVGHPLSSVPLEVGAVYRLYFDKKGRVDMLMRDKT